MTTERPDQLRWPTPAEAVAPKAGYFITTSRNEGRAGHASDVITHPCWLFDLTSNPVQDTVPVILHHYKSWNRKEAMKWL